MGRKLNVVLLGLCVLSALTRVAHACNIRELNNVIEDHFKKELQLKKCAGAGQKCQLDTDCCKHLECKMGVSDDGIINFCKKKEVILDDRSDSGMNVEDYQEKTGDADNLDWMNKDDRPDSTEQKKETARTGNNAYSDEGETVSGGRDKKKEKRREELIKENEELEKLFTEKEEREIDQLKALKEDAEIDELRKLRELKIKRKLQLLKELQELRSLKANDDYRQILDLKEKRKLNDTIGESVKRHNHRKNHGKKDLSALEAKTHDNDTEVESEHEENTEDKEGSGKQGEDADIEEGSGNAEGTENKQVSGNVEDTENQVGSGSGDDTEDKEGSGNGAEASGDGEIDTDNADAAGNEGSGVGEEEQNDEGSGGDDEESRNKTETMNGNEELKQNETMTRSSAEQGNSTT